MPPRTDSFEGLHVLLVTEDDARAQAIAKALRERRAHVGDVRKGSRDPVALRGADLLVIDARHAAASDARVNEVRSDVRARWASVATIDYAALANDDGTIDLRALEGIVTRLAGMDKALTERARREQTFEASLAPLGPTRTLRALALSGPTLHVELSDGSLKATVDLADELLVAAFAERSGQRFEAWSALARVLGMTDATIKVERRAHPTAMNIMEPVDQALEMAAQERAQAPEAFAKEERTQADLSGLRREPQAPVGAQAAVAGQAGGGMRSLPPRQRTLVGVPAAIPPASASTPAPASMSASAPASMQAETAAAAAPVAPVAPPPPTISIRPAPGRPSLSSDAFADIPTDPASPGLLQRMARKPANDTGLPQVQPVEPPQVSYDVLPSDDDDDNGDDDAGEVTVIADAQQLDALRETLERIDAPGARRISSTMPAPPSGNEPEIELVRGAFSERPLPAVSPSSRARARSSTPSTPSEQSAAASAFGSLPPPPAPQEPRTLSGGSLLPGTSRKPRPQGPSVWVVVGAIVALVAIAVAVYLANRR